MSLIHKNKILLITNSHDYCYIDNIYYFIDDDDDIWKRLENDEIITLSENKRDFTGCF